MEEKQSYNIGEKTIKKVFDQRCEFIIIGLTSSTDSDLSLITDRLTSDFDSLNLPNQIEGDVIEQLEYQNIRNYAEVHWKEFDLIKARDIIISYILESRSSLKRFYSDISRELFTEVDFYNRVYTSLRHIRNDLSSIETVSHEEINREIENFLDNCHHRGLDESLLQKNKELTSFISDLRAKDRRYPNKGSSLSLYVYTKYILPRVGKIIREIVSDVYVNLFQKYGNEIRFFGTLDIFRWRECIEKINESTRNEHLYSIAKRLNTFIKIRRTPIPNQRSVPVRIVIDSLKNIYECSFLKDRYSAYYTFALLSGSKENQNDRRFEETRHNALYESPSLIKKNFLTFIRLINEQLEREEIEADQSTSEYLAALKSPSQFLNYVYTNLPENNSESFDYLKIFQMHGRICYSHEYAQFGIMKDEFAYYIKILKDFVRTFCMISGLYPFFLQDIQSAIQNSDVFIGENSKNNMCGKELDYQIVKYVSLIMHPGLVPPTKEERCMQAAFSAKVSSGCISRQVGAVIADKDYNILSVGWNDVHCEKVPCIYRNLYDLQRSGRHDIYSDLELKSTGVIQKYVVRYNFGNQNLVNRILEGLPSAYCFKSLYNRLMNEKNPSYSRSIHAEARALWACNKELTIGGSLFTTSSSCENCTMLANEYSIKKIYYIETYPGISQEHVNASGKYENRAEFILFTGAIGTAYMKLYTPVMPLKDELEIRGLHTLCSEQAQEDEKWTDL